LHDSNGLAVPDGERPRLTIIVLSNDGGGIFELLEPSDVAAVSRPTFERVFGTPHGADLAALCGAHHVPFTRVGTTDELLAATMDPRADMQVVELRADRVATAETHRKLQKSVHELGMP
jgi:2-succinyl-5-enolpyruvyl-6-hydroxy-3-cyclohexene-1-carboxylate synthase